MVEAVPVAVQISGSAAVAVAGDVGRGEASAAGTRPAGRRQDAPSVGRRHEAGGTAAGRLRHAGARPVNVRSGRTGRETLLVVLAAATMDRA